MYITFESEIKGIFFSKEKMTLIRIETDTKNSKEDPLIITKEDIQKIIEAKRK